MGCNGSPVGNPLQLSKFRVKLSKSIKHFATLTIATGQRQVTKASNGSERLQHWSATGGTSKFNGFAMAPSCKPVPLPVKDFLEDGTYLVATQLLCEVHSIL